MDAFRAGAPVNDRGSRTEASSQYCVPQVSCDICGETWADTEVWYPSCTIKKEADLSKLSLERIVSTEELKALRRWIDTHDRPLKLIPGAGIGPIKARLPTRPTDFLWCGFRLLVQHTVATTIKKRGFEITYGPPVLQINGAESDYVALECDPVPLYSEATIRELTLKVCPECGSCEMQNVRAKMSGPREFVKSRIPEEKGLVRVYESPATIATGPFMEMVKSDGFSGIQFDKIGIYA